jgi:hypothetical protein
MGLTESVKDTMYLNNLLEEIGTVMHPIVTNIDNLGSGFMAENSVNSKRNKHISVRQHYCRQFVQDKTIDFQYVSTDENTADIMTKPLPAPKFIKFMKRLLKMRQ